MSKKTIGVIGSYGAVGQLLIDYLKDNYHIITTYYSSRRNEADIYIDIYQPSTMRSLIKQCDVVVNCAGPSYLVSAQISEWMNHHHIPYIDLFGGDALEKAINSFPRNVPHIINAGSQPGLSGLMVLRMAEICDTFPSELQIYQGGNEVGGDVAFIDMLLSIVEGYGKSNYYIENDEGVFETREDMIHLDDNKYAYTQLYFTKELERIRKRVPIRALKSYILFGNEHAKKLLMNGYGIMSQNNLTMRQKIERIKLLTEKYQNNLMPWFMLRVEANDGNMKRVLSVKEESSLKLTALVAWLSVEKIVNEELAPNCYWACDVLSPAKTVERMKLEGIHIEETVYEHCERMEEGEI